jgi:thiamine pyrophosphate-dependent acetolactate synthase large subunit-like protein
VGLIGAREKLSIVEQLTQREEYRNFLGIEKFEDYIPIPQKFAADNPEKVLEEVRSMITKSKSDIFLLGMGHAKSWIIPELRTFKEAIYIDVGSGIDALAGMIDPKRPYFGGWKNYRLSNDAIYDDVDYLQFSFENIVLLP